MYYDMVLFEVANKVLMGSVVICACHTIWDIEIKAD